jgi:hypothetical protein
MLGLMVKATLVLKPNLGKGFKEPWLSVKNLFKNLG